MGRPPLWELIRFDDSAPSLERVPNALWRDGAATVRHNPLRPAIPLSELPAPDFSYVPFETYLTTRDGMQLPFLLSHGCYWKKCAFCNNQLSLVTDFHVQDVRAHILPKIRHHIQAYGIRRLRFVDETMPPVTLAAFSREVIEEELGIMWHGNIRSESFFTPSVCRLMAEAGCYEVMVGVESFNDDTLKAMKKGMTAERIIEVVSNFTAAGIKVHAYLIYGWPSETRSHLANTLKVLKRLMRTRRISSAYWHFFSINPSAPMFKDLASYDVRTPKIDPSLDIFDEVMRFETTGNTGLLREPAHFRRIEQRTSRLEERLTAPQQAGRRDDSQGLFCDTSQWLDKFVVFPGMITMCEGRYSLAQIAERSGPDRDPFQRKRRFRIMTH